MSIVEKEALKFSGNWGFYKNARTLKSLKSNLTDKLYDFNREQDKLDFLRVLRSKTLKDKEEHAKTCRGCSFDEIRTTALFVIDQELDEINSYYTYSLHKEYEFTSKEESELHNKLNDISDYLKELGFGQEIIFQELDELKNHFNLGKKNWFQLLKGKVVDLTLKKIIDKTIVKEIYNQLSDGYEEVVSVLID